jgi:hypothetical protein
VHAWTYICFRLGCLCLGFPHGVPFRWLASGSGNFHLCNISDFVRYLAKRYPIALAENESAGTVEVTTLGLMGGKRTEVFPLSEFTTYQKLNDTTIILRMKSDRWLLLSTSLFSLCFGLPPCVSVWLSLPVLFH